MAVTQYIGARYVPKFYENSDGTEEWRAGVEYEPLTIVTYNGNSYTSKKPVPSNIGNPSDNPSYWASTGNYNQQVEEYRQQVEEYKAEVDDISNQFDNLATLDALKGHILFIGDSYITAVTPSWADIVGQRFGKVRNSTYFVSAKGGTGFNAAVDNVNFLTLLTTATVADENKVTAIIVQGGSNDIFAANITGIDAGITAFCNAAKTRFPNARIFIGMCDAWIETAWSFSVRDELYRRYQDGAANNGAFFLGATGTQLKLEKATLMQDDLKHPTANGMTAIAKETICNMLGQQVVTQMINNTQYYYKRTGDEVKITFWNNLNYIPDPVISSITCNGVTTIDIPCSGGNVIINDDFERGFVMTTMVSGGNYYDVPAALQFTHTGIRLSPIRMNSDNTNFLTIENVRQIVIRGGNSVTRPGHVIG